MAAIKTLDGRDFEPELPNRLLNIANEIRAAGGRAYLVGGWVRDALLARDCRDYDVEVYSLSQEALIDILKRYGKTNLVGKAFGVIHLSMKGLSLDFSFPRTESKIGYGHRGFVVHTDEKLSFVEAALRRDFTINAMGMELPELTLCDPYGGIEDLKKGVLRHVGPAFVEDSLRILRGVQFASRFSLSLAPETVELCRSLTLSDLSIERLFEEFKKWLLKPGKPSCGLKAFLDIKLDEYFPEIRPFKESWEMLGNILDRMAEQRDNNGLSDAQTMEFAFAALLSGNAFACGNADVIRETVLKFLSRITNEIHLVRHVPELLACYGKLNFCEIPADSELRRISVRLGGLKLLCLLAKATPRELLRNSEFADSLSMAAKRLGIYDAAPEPFLTGRMLIEMGVKPGKQMGDVIKDCFEQQLDGNIVNVEQAIAWTKSHILQF